MDKPQFQTQLFINNEFVDAHRWRAPSTCSTRSTTRCSRKSPRPSLPTSIARWRPRARPFPAWAAVSPSDRGVLIGKLADAIEKDRDNLSLIETPRHRAPDPRHAQPRRAAHGRDLPLLRRHAGQERRHGDPGRHRLPELRDARAGGRGGSGGAVEFPADVHQLEAGPRAGRRQLRGHEAGGADAAVDAARGGAGARSRLSARASSTWCRATATSRASTSPSTGASTRSRSPARRPPAARSCRPRPATSSACSSSWAARARTSCSRMPTSPMRSTVPRSRSSTTRGRPASPARA